MRDLWIYLGLMGFMGFIWVYRIYEIYGFFLFLEFIWDLWDLFGIYGIDLGFMGFIWDSWDLFERCTGFLTVIYPSLRNGFLGCMETQNDHRRYKLMWVLRGFSQIAQKNRINARGFASFEKRNHCYNNKNFYQIFFFLNDLCDFSAFLAKIL